MADLVSLALDAGAVWIARGYSDEVSAVRLDAATNSIVATVDIGAIGAPYAPIIAVGAGSVWLASLSQGTVSRIDSVANTVVATIDLRSAESPGIATFTGPLRDCGRR